MSEQQTTKMGQSIDGISLSSFLQLLEQERNCCTLVVNDGDNSGQLFFNDGKLIDAEFFDEHGLEAAYTILSWENTTFYLSEPEERINRISQPLGHILLSASTKKDEQNAPEKPQQAPPAKQKGSTNPALAAIIQKLTAIPGVKHYYLLNRQGKMITQSSTNQKMGDFIAYCIVSGIQMREALGAKGLHNIRIRFPEENMLLIIPMSGLTIGLMLSEKASLSDVYKRLRAALTVNKSKPNS